MLPIQRCQGCAVRRRSACSPKLGSRGRVEQRAPVPDDRAAADPGSPAHAGAKEFRAPSTAPIYLTARPTETAGTGPDRRTSKARTTSEVGNREATDLRADAALRT